LYGYWDLEQEALFVALAPSGDVGGFDVDGAAEEVAAPGDGADAVRSKSLPAGPANTLAVGAYLAALSQMDMTLGRVNSLGISPRSMSLCGVP
jgi:hypothetical protein